MDNRRSSGNFSSKSTWHGERSSSHGHNYNTTEDIKNNLGSLGKGRRILIWYGSPANITGGESNLRRDRIYKFACHLITYGFDVKIDMFVTLTTESDWARWIDHEMSRAEWIICVCSQSLYTMLHNVNGLEKEVHSLSLAAKNSSFYTRAFYNRLFNDTDLKIIPVILLQEDNNLAFVPPTLRDPKNILYIYEDTPFNVENLSGNFERLVCRMAGIDRIALNTTTAQFQHNRGGYVKLASKIPKDDGYFEKPVMPQPRVGNSHLMHKNYGEPMQRIQSGQQYNGYSQKPRQQQFHQQHPARQNLNGFVEVPSKYTPTTPHCVPQQPAAPVSVHHGRNFQSSHIQEKNSVHSSNNSKPLGCPRLRPAAVETKVSGNGNLPDSKIPVNSPILLMLSQEVKEWKFLGRYLDLEEETIDEIDYNTVPNKTREKALKVFTEWVNSSAPTWAILGEALLDAENIMLYEKLMELISGYRL